HSFPSIRTLVGKVGGDVRLHIGATEVDRDAHIVWSYGPKYKVIISYDDGTSETKLSEKFQLDANGSLTIRSLTANDSGLYNCEIFSKNGSSQKTFTLTFPL
uniref:Ig-like domain-containing protein n=1 Tax=Maylandia zebra TaxID=106582 RepID=A0A3P9C606_9CICH